MPKSITVNTVQGIGDIFWVYQKLAPHFEVVHMNILCIDLGPVQLRAKPFCAMLPKIGNVTYQKVAPTVYHQLAQARIAMADVLRRAPRPVDYAVNAPLEAGINLRDIDPGIAVDEFVDLGLPETVQRGDYLCAFVAGAKGSQVWPAARWVDVIRKIAGRMSTKQIVLIGAEWDKPVQDPIFSDLRRAGYKMTTHVGTMGLADSIGVIRESRFFVGFQSGLNVLAENYDVPQMMVYFAKLRPMMYTWCKPSSVGTSFHAMTFADDPAPVINGLALLPVATS